MKSNPKIAVTFTTANARNQALALSKKLNLPAVNYEEAAAYDFLLNANEKRIELLPVAEKDQWSFYIDFLSGKLTYRRSHAFIKNELLARAVGIKGNATLTVIDGTAGLGRDSFILAHLGCKVLMLERSPIIAALLQDALDRLKQAQACSDQKPLHLQLLCTDASVYLQKLAETDYPEVIYLDPMYPERTKTALVKKEMRILRALAGDDDDADQLLILALQKAKKRVVVKRPKTAPFLNQQKPDFSQAGKQHRFDVYLKKS